jgi:hypothetical protein
MPATLQLMSETITTAQTASTKTAVTGLARAKSVALHCNFTYGSGGTSATVYVQTSFDGGSTWVDIANFDHATASLRRVYNLSALTPVTTVYTATDGSLSANTCKDGVIGDQLRVKFTSVGTYAGSTTMVVTAVVKD